MIKMIRIRGISGPLLGLVTGIAIMLASPGMAQAWMLKLPLEVLSAGADSIIIGTVVEQNSYWNTGHSDIYTSVVISVEESLKGVAGRDKITLIIPGGKVGDTTQWVEDTAAFNPGERVVVFLAQLDQAELPDMLAAGQQPDTPKYGVFGHYQGKFSILQDSVGNLSLAQFKEQVNLMFKGEPSPGNMSLEALTNGTGPSITWVSPNPAPAGTGSPNSRVVISGSGFGATQGTGKVYFKPAGYSAIDAGICPSWSDTSITVLVPARMDSNYLYVVTAGGTTSNNFTLNVTFSYDGYKWPGANPVVNYKVNENCPSTTGEASAIQAAAATWNAATGTNFTLNYAGTTTETTPGYPECRIWWQEFVGDPFTSALSSVSTSGGVITEAHIQFNTHFSWSTAGTTPSGYHDVESITLHEFGHWLSLHDQNGYEDSAKVMYGEREQGPGGVRRALTNTDRDGIQWIYGAAAPSHKDEIGVWRGSTRYFYVDTDDDGKYTNPAAERRGTFLSSYVNGDAPVAGDWDNDGTDEIGVWRKSTRYFYLDKNGDGKYTNPATERLGPFLSATQANDRPIAGDWNGTGTDEIGVWRGSTRYFYLDKNNNGKYDGTYERLGPFLSTSDPSDRPVVGDWNGDGTDEIGVWRGATRYFYLDTNGNGVYNGIATERLGPFLSGYVSGDAPVAGDWDRDGSDEVGVWRKSTRYFFLDTNGDGKYTNPATERLGPFLSSNDSTDAPVAGNWDGL